MKLDIDACNRNDYLNAMRLWFRTLIKKFAKSYLKKEENYNNASAKKWDKLIKESDVAYLKENITKQKNKNFALFLLLYSQVLILVIIIL